MNIISIIKKFKQLLSRNQKRKISFLFLIMIIGAFFETLGVSMMVPLVNVILKPNTETNIIINRIEILILIYIAKNLFLYIEYNIRAKFIFNSKFETKKHLFHEILEKPYEYYLNTSSGEILRTLNSDVDQTYNLLLSTLSLVSELFVSIALVVTIFVIDPYMSTIIAVVLSLTVLLVSLYIKPKLNKKGTEFRAYNSQMYKWVLQAIQGIKEIKIAKNESYFEDKYNEAGLKSANASSKEYVLSTTPRTIIEVACVCSTLIAIAIMISNGTTSETLLPTLGAFAMAAVRLMPTATRIIALAGSIAYEGPAIDNLLANIKNIEKIRIDNKQSDIKLEIKDNINIQNISYTYPNTTKQVLSNISINIPIGSSVGIKGKSGIGKTTLIDVILGLLTQTSGTISVGGIDTKTNYEDWLSHIGYIPQSIFLLDDSIKNNVVFGSDIDEKRLEHALKDSQLYDFVQSLDNKADTQVGERGVKLSGGQKQRIGIARALYKNPEILIFDEATSSLDNETEKAIIESINSLHGKKTMIIIAHRLETIKKCDFVIELKEN